MQEKQDKTFSTQATILKMLGVQNSKGMCSSLSNLYASYQMGSGSRAFLDEGPEKTYKYAQEMKDHQSKVTEEVSASHGVSMGNLIGMHVAFFDSRKKFKGEDVSVEELVTAERAKKVFQDSEHVLINYPTDGEQSKVAPYHQVYYGHTAGTHKCSYFNANISGGEKEGNCDEVLQMVVDDIISSAAHDGRACIVGRTI